MTTEHINERPKGAFLIREGGRKVGELTYVWAGDDRFIIDHTWVHPDLRGRGVGQALVKAAVAYARTEGVAVTPQCPYAAAEFARHPEYGE